MKKNGFTLIEMLVVVSMLALILFPTYRILSHGSKSAMRGAERSNLVNLGQRLLGQVKADLSLSCFEYKDGELHGVDNIFKETNGADEIKYSFFTYHGGKQEYKVVPTNSGGISYRRFNKIEYCLRLKPDGQNLLERKVYYHPKNPMAKKTKAKLLSDQVNFFEIRPVTVISKGVARNFFRISLQLFGQKNKAKLNKAGKAFIADFVDTVNPLVLNSIINNPGLNRNWYTDPHSQK